LCLSVGERERDRERRRIRRSKKDKDYHKKKIKYKEKSYLKRQSESEGKRNTRQHINTHKWRKKREMWTKRLRNQQKERKWRKIDRIRDGDKRERDIKSMDRGIEA
jgi:hypothetical protein